MRSKADETFLIVETLICPLQISNLLNIITVPGYYNVWFVVNTV